MISDYLNYRRLVKAHKGKKLDKKSISQTVKDAFIRPEPFAEESKLYTVFGTDVSKWQGNIDWEAVSTDGIEFAMIRLGLGTADGYNCTLDPKFEQNVIGAVTAGVNIGCYFYSHAMSEEAIAREAEYVVKVLQDYPGVFTYPVALDIENADQQTLGKATLTSMVCTFCSIITSAGFYCSLYSNPNWLTNYLDDSSIQHIDHWLAHWTNDPTYDKDYGMWQYTSTGAVAGIKGNVDLDIAYRDYPKIIYEAGLNGFNSEDAVEPTCSGDSISRIALRDEIIETYCNVCKYYGRCKQDCIINAVLEMIKHAPDIAEYHGESLVAEESDCR